MSTLVLLMLVLPLAGAIIAAVLGPKQGPTIRAVSLASTIATFVVAVIIAYVFAAPRIAAEGALSPGEFAGQPQMETTIDIMPLGKESSIQFHIGIDGLNLWLIVLTAVLMVPAVLISWTAITERVNEYYAWLLALQCGMVGVFLSFDIILFYIFFELTLVPLFFLIGIWGGPDRQYAARKFFIFTLTGSLITLLGVLGISIMLSQLRSDHELSFSIPRLTAMVGDYGRTIERDLVVTRAQTVDETLKEETREAKKKDVELLLKKRTTWRSIQFWVFLAMMAGFAIKVPLIPFHTWLPLAHVEAPTAGSVLLAGVLLKIGTYGFMRLCVPLAPDASLSFGAPFIGWLATIGILYGAFCALAQDDIKKLVAYSSVSHLGYCMLGLFALNEIGMTGSLMQMINHGLSTGGLFLLVGMLYERYHTRRMADYGGMAAKLKLLSLFMVFITMSSVALPGLNGFVGEALILAGMWNFSGTQVSGTILAGLSAFGALLGAWYMLTLLRNVFFGQPREPRVHFDPHHAHGPTGDLNVREIFCLAPIAILCLALGVYPKPFLDSVKPEMKALAAITKEARDRAN